MRFLLIFAGAALLGSAQTLDVKPGLWETTTVSEGSGAPPIDTSKMSPEQKARVEAAIKARMAPATNVLRQCLSKDKLDKLFQPTQPQNASCKNTVVSSSGSAMQMKMVCTGPRTLTADIHIEAASRENMKGSVQVVAGDGTHSMTMKSTMTSKWLGDACGDVK